MGRSINRRIFVLLPLLLAFFLLTGCNKQDSPNTTGGSTTASNSGSGNANAASPTASPTPKGLHIKRIYMALGNDQHQPGEPMTSFQPSARTLFCVAEFSEDPRDARMQSKWIAVDTDEWDKNQVIFSKEGTASGLSAIKFFIDREGENEWPPGKYKVEVSINDRVEKSVDFTIQ